MIGQNFEEHTEAAKVPWDAALIHLDPMNETVAADEQMNETVVQEAPMGETIVYKDSMGETVVHKVPTGANAASSVALLDREESEHLRTRWNEIQGRFVDEPASSVQQADALISEVIVKITRTIGNEHSSLEGQWKQGNDITTEDLRKVLQRYRSLFDRLVEK